MNSASAKRLAKVHPLLAEKVQVLAKALAPMQVNIEVVQGLRTWAEQDALYAQGRTKAGKRVTNARGGQSNHNYGLAVDVCPFKNGKAQWEDDAGFAAIGAEAKKLGLDWGGDWRRLKDMPHVQLGGMSIDECFNLYKRGGLDAVWKRAMEVNESVDVESLEPAPETPAEVITHDPTDADKGVTTGDKLPEDIAGTPPPAPAVEVKASSPSLMSKITSLGVPAGVLSAIGGIWTFVQGMPPWGWAVLGGVFVVALVIGAWLYNESMKRSQQRTSMIMAAAADKESNNLRLI